LKEPEPDDPKWVVRLFLFSTEQKEMNEMRSAKDRKNAKVAVQQYTTTAAHLHPAAEALAAVVGGSPDCPTDEEVL
jgi:hypothetical protein